MNRTGLTGRTGGTGRTATPPPHDGEDTREPRKEDSAHLDRVMGVMLLLIAVASAVGGVWWLELAVETFAGR